MKDKIYLLIDISSILLGEININYFKISFRVIMGDFDLFFSFGITWNTSHYFSTLSSAWVLFTSLAMLNQHCLFIFNCVLKPEVLER